MVKSLHQLKEYLSKISRYCEALQTHFNCRLLKENSVNSEKILVDDQKLFLDCLPRLTDTVLTMSPNFVYLLWIS